MSAGLERLVRFYETLTPQSLPAIAEVYAPHARFKDPFNDVAGLDAIAAIFRHMFEQVGEPRFEVTASIAQGRRAALEWVFHFHLRGRHFEVRGASVIDFDDDERVIMHRDYWDTGEELYARLPGVGVLIRFLRRRMSATDA